jgi:N-acetylmuramoyl-L-alanine amidase
LKKAVLIETAFMMHPEDNWHLLTPEYQKKFSRGMMEGIVEYFLSL